MAQPNSNAIDQAIVSLTNEAALPPNILTPNQSQLTQISQQLLQQSAQMNETLAQIEQRLQDM